MEACFQPIHGISLERYAELGAAIADAGDDAAKVREIIAAEGVADADWEAAKAGWTARMQDMALMGRVASAYMPLYREALAKKKGGRAAASYEDFVAVSAAIKVFGYEVGIGACRVSAADWTEIAGHWTSRMAADMMSFAGHAGAIANEESRIRGGGAPRAIAVTLAPAQAQQTVTPANALPHAATLPSAGQMPAVQMPAMHGLGLGFGLQQAAAFFSGGVSPGASVFVLHPTSRERFPARVLSTMPQHTLVQFNNGAQQWVPAGAVERA